MATKKKGYRPFHNHNNNHYGTRPCEFIPDEGPAQCAMLFESPDGDLGFSAVRFYKTTDEYGKTKDQYMASDEAEPLRGFICTKSRTEDYSVHEIRLVPPKLRMVFKNERDCDGKKNPLKVSIVSGPCIVTVPSVVYHCQNCGDVIKTSREFLEKNTNEKVVTLEMDGKKVERRIRVAKDDLAEIKGIKDLASHHCQCIVCKAEVKDVKPKFWTLDDGRVVHPAAKKAAIELLEEIRMMTVNGVETPPMSAAIPRISIAGVPWDEAVKAGTFARARPHVDFSRKPHWVLQNAQDLRNMGFGDSKQKQSYWGLFGFKPRDIKREAPRPGEAVLGDIYDFSGLIG